MCACLGSVLAGLNEPQVRRYPSWARRVTLAMLTHTFLAAVRAEEHAHRPTPDDPIPLSCNKICRLFIALVVRPEWPSSSGWSLGVRHSQPLPRRGRRLVQHPPQRLLSQANLAAGDQPVTGCHPSMPAVRPGAGHTS